jgi:hypothetical protein
MDIHITQPDLEARLTQSAAQQGRHPDEFVQDVLAQYFDEEARVVPSVEPKNLVELFAPLRGQFTDEEVDTLFGRNRATARPLDLA